jgi:hypothetical protein
MNAVRWCRWVRASGTSESATLSTISIGSPRSSTPSA